MPLHDDALGTTAHGVPYLVWHHCHPVTSRSLNP